MRHLFPRRAAAPSPSRAAAAPDAIEPVNVVAKLRHLNDAVRSRVNWDALEKLGLVEPGTDPSDLLGLTVRPSRDEKFIRRAAGLALEVDICDVSEMVRRRTRVWVIGTIPAPATAAH